MQFNRSTNHPRESNMAKKKPEGPASEVRNVEVIEVALGRVSIAAVGTMPLICNRMSEKVKGILLVGSEKKNTAAKALARGLKHDPMVEFGASPYTLSDESAPTLLAGLSVWFKKSMMTAALDTPGVKKAQIGRLVRAEGERLALYGVPQIFLSVTRSADINRTPDVRTRAILPRWAMFVDFTYDRAFFTEKAIVGLLARAGLFCGVGDWRTEKGSGNYGSFRLAGPDDPELQEIVQGGGRVEPGLCPCCTDTL